jgi:NADP-dependent 3-hydroxy acid dehydrogenase YdfG
MGNERLVRVSPAGASAGCPRDRELVDHITHEPTKQTTERFSEVAITADDVARIIAFAVGQPRSVSLNEILVRPTAQA